MEFYQYATGRNLGGGYDKIYRNEDIPLSFASACGLRDLTNMEGGSRVYELRPLDQQHIALQMTAICQFGGKGANYCYTHSLISKEYTAPCSLMPLLQPENFFTDKEFQALESQHNCNIPMQKRELTVASAADPLPVILPENCSKAEVCALINYIWEQCDKNSRREKVTPATVVLPAHYNHQDMLDFVSKVVLPVLPDSMKIQLPIVFGSNRDFAGSFPANTVCYVMQETERTQHQVYKKVYKPVFEPFSARHLEDIDIPATPGNLLLAKALGKTEEEHPLYHSVMSALPASCGDSYLIANALLKICLSFDKADATVKKLLGDWKLYNELSSSLPSETNVYQVLLPLETALLERVQKHISEYTIPELAQLLTLDRWGQAERDKLTAAVLAHYTSAEDELDQLMDSIKDCGYPSVTDMLHAQLQQILIDNIAAEPTATRFGRLWKLLWDKPVVHGLQALLSCADRITLSSSQADDIAKITPKLLGLNDNALTEHLMQLFETKKSASAMRTILEQLNYRYDRAQWTQWDAVERRRISDLFTADLKEVLSAVSPEQQVQAVCALQITWRKRFEQKHHREWSRFPREIGQAENTLQQTISDVLGNCISIHIYKLLENQLQDDWYRIAALEQAAEELKRNLDGIYASETPEMLSDLSALLDKLGVEKDARASTLMIAEQIRRSASLDAAAQMTELNNLYALYQKNPTTTVSLYVRNCALNMPTPQPEELEKYMIWHLIQHIDEPANGWKAFFESLKYTPDKGGSPWSDNNLWLVNRIGYIMHKLTALQAAAVWQNELLHYIAKDPAWMNFRKHLTVKEYAKFIKDASAEVPELYRMLNAH